MDSLSREVMEPESESRVSWEPESNPVPESEVMEPESESRVSWEPESDPEVESEVAEPVDESVWDELDEIVSVSEELAVSSVSRGKMLLVLSSGRTSRESVSRGQVSSSPSP
jgi:hypothetical protein